jgi:hydroxyethylthiazole kinase-like uncharacterized protein yjeF
MLAMRLLTTTDLRQAEQRAAQTLPARTLMLRAAQAAANLAIAQFREPYLVLAGPGNNGGDALETALLLQQAWQQVSIVLLAEPSQLTVDARQAYERCRVAQLNFLPTLPESLSGFHCVIDGLFGIGLKRALEQPLAHWVTSLNHSGVPILALDIPSGLNADTGRVVGGASGVAVKATQTLTFIAGKPGLWTAQGPEYCGQIQVADLVGVSETHFTPCPNVGALNSPEQFRPALRLRQHDSHKGSFGNVHIVGGQSGMAGAALLAGRAALFSGTGRVYVHSLAGLELDPLHPELMLRQAQHRPEPSDLSAGVNVCGPGLGSSEQAQAWLETCLHSQNALVLDADALNLLAQDQAWKKLLHARQAATVLTPHPLEAARLLQEQTVEVNADRLRAARELAEIYGATVVLKGAGSIITRPAGLPTTQGPVWRINPTGNPGLASAGTGDVLAGVTGALIAGTLQHDRNKPLTALALAFDCACAAVWLHGKAAEELTADPRQAGTIGLTATELLPALRRCLNELTNDLAQS